MSIHQVFHLEIQTAFDLTQTKIVELFNNIKVKFDYYEVINDTPTRESFAKVVERIETLLQKKSVFPDGDALTVSYQGTNFELETLFDLVGWIFSVTGQTPNNATSANYYYPLVILYCQWCRTLCANEKKEPQMVQITWFPEGSTKRVCLGSNLDKPKRTRKDAARIKRFDRLLKDNLAKEDEREKSYVGDGGQLIGHCAESFPALFIKSLGNKVTLADVRGVAVKPFKALSSEVANKFAVPDTEARKELLEDPCNNCKVVLPRLGSHINLDNFSILKL